MPPTSEPFSYRTQDGQIGSASKRTDIILLYYFLAVVIGIAVLNTIQYHSHIGVYILDAIFLLFAAWILIFTIDKQRLKIWMEGDELVRSTHRIKRINLKRAQIVRVEKSGTGYVRLYMKDGRTQMVVLLVDNSTLKPLMLTPSDLLKIASVLKHNPLPGNRETAELLQEQAEYMRTSKDLRSSPLRDYTDARIAHLNTALILLRLLADLA